MIQSAPFNGARRRNRTVPVSVFHHGVLLAEQRLIEFEGKARRSDEEEREYLRLFAVKDFLIDDAIPRLERAMSLAVNDECLRRTFLAGDRTLADFPIGLQNAVFAHAPVFLGRLNLKLACRTAEASARIERLVALGR